MKRVINSKKNKYKICVHPSFCKTKLLHDKQGEILDAVHFAEQNAKHGDYLHSLNRDSLHSENGDHIREGITSMPDMETLFSSTKEMPFLHKGEQPFLFNGPSPQGGNKVAHQLVQLGGLSSHFGRKLRNLDFPFPWHASMCNKFSGIRNKVPHIDVKQTLQSLGEAFYCVALVLRKGGKVLIVNKNHEFSPLFHGNSLDAKSHLSNRSRSLPENLNNRNLPSHLMHLTKSNATSNATSNALDGTRSGLASNVMQKSLSNKIKRQTKEGTSIQSKGLIRKYAGCRDKCRPATAPFKWVGGCLTNWKEISKSVATLLYFSKRFGRFIKQNNIHFPRFKKMKTSFQGFINPEKGELLLKAPPQLVFLFNVQESQQILHEAIRLQIPVVALTDSSTDLSQITYPIPINSDSAPLVHRCLSQLMQITDREGSFLR